MKRLFNKHNPISRVVALWLVFVMMAVPFFSNSGLLSNPKANSGGTEVVGSISLDGYYHLCQNDFAEVTGSVNVKDSGTRTINYYDVDKIQVTAGEIKLYDQTVSPVTYVDSIDAELNSVIYKISNCDVKLVVANSGASTQTITDDVAANATATAEATVTQEVGVYIKPTVTDPSDVAVLSEYSLYEVIKFEEKNPFDTTSGFTASVQGKVTTSDNLEDIDNSKYYKILDITAIGSKYQEPSNVVGEIQYGYVAAGGNDTEIQGLSNVSLFIMPSDLSGSYDMKVCYVVGGQILASYTAATVNVDTEKPSIDNEKTGLYYRNGGWQNQYQNYTEGTKVTEDVVVRTDSEKSDYRYFVVVDESGSGVTNSNIKMYKGDDEDSVTFTAVNGQTGVFYTDAFVTANGSIDIYTVKATDLMGNESSASNILNVLELVDTSMRDIELTWGKDSSSLNVLPDLGADDVVTDSRYKLHFNITSYEKFNKLEVVDGGNVVRAQYQFYTHPTPEPYYEYEYEIDVPLSEENAEYSDLKIRLYFNNDINTPAVIKNLTDSFVLDNTDPVFKDASGNNEYSIPTTWNPNEADIKIDILSGEKDAESDLVTARYEVGGHMHNFTITDGKVDDGAIDIANIPESTDANGTPITIYAKDAADNETTTTVYYKKDTIEPSPSVYFSKDNGTTKLGPDDIINKEYTVYSEVGETGSGVNKINYFLYDSTSAELKTVEKQGTQGCPLSELLPDNATDGTYSVKVLVTDNAGNWKYSGSYNFVLDTTAPTMPDSFWPILQVYDGTNWVNIVNGNEEGTDKLNENEIIGYTPWGTEIRKSIYYIDASKQYRYLVKVVDAGGVSDTPEEVIKLKNNEVPGIVDNATPLEEDGAKIFYINIDNGKLSANLHKTVDFTITDKAGNTKNDVSAFWGLKLIDTQISITPTLYEKVDGNLIAVSLTEALKDELAKGTSKPYFIVLDVSSAYTIDGNTITLSYYNHENTLITMTGTDYNTEKGYDPTISDSSGRYHYYKMYDMEGTSNISYKNLEMSAADTNSQLVNNTNVLSMLYDITDPIMYSDSSKTTYFTLPSAWAKNVSGSIYIIPGEDTVVESALAKAYFDVEGEDGVNNLGMDMAGTSAGGTVETPANFSSATTAGTKITVYAEDAAGNDVTWEQTVKVDAKAPTIDSVSVAGNPNILVSDAPLKAAPTITAKVTDNLTVDYIKMTVTYPDGAVKEKTFDYAEGVDAEVNGAAKEVSYTIPKLAATDVNIPDGAYRVEVKAFDLAGNEATSVTKSFRVDTTKPVVTAKISSGTVSAKDSYYYKSNVVVALTYNDVNINMPSIVVTDNGTPVNVNWSTSPDANGNYTATYTASTEGVHAIKIIAKDAATNDAVPSEVEFKIDKTLPTLSTTVNGLVYTDNTGLLYMTNNVTLNASVNDTNEDRGDLNYQLILTKPDQETVTNLYQKTTDRSFTYTEEGEYTINLFAIDKANNQSSIRSIRFRVDKAAPNLSINGVGSGSSADSVTVSCVMQESFWRDAEGTITIYSRAGDGVPEVLLKTINVTPTSASTVISETFTETGVYRIEFTASDRAGHTSETSTQFTIDRESPVVTLDGPENYTKTKDEVPIAITVVDDFYLQKKVNLVATRTDDTGKVHDLDFGTWNEGGNPTNIAGTFAEDGIYDISITATDMAGNSDSKSVHFTIDKSAPIIGDLSYLDDQILTSFSWDEDLDELVSDLTVCDVQMYLNGSVYDGESEIEDGAYTLLIVAEDELGNKTEKEVTFVLDTKVPVFIVTGVEEDEVKNEEYSISVSLQLEEDTLTSVTLNGKEMYSGDNNVCSFTVSEKGEYKLVMSATDAAGNTASYELEFKYGEDSMWWLWLIIAIAVLLVSGIVLIVIKKKNNDK